MLNVIKVTTAWLLAQDPNRYKIHLQKRKYSYIDELKKFLVNPHTTNEIIEHINIRHNSIASICKRCGATQIVKPKRNQQAIWKIK